MPCQGLPLPPALPRCQLCLCIGTSVYCDDADLEHIPPLPPETTYLYARFNRIGTIRASDFTGLSTLGRGKGQALHWGTGGISSSAWIPAHLLLPLSPEKLKRIDLSSNFISRADADAFRLLPSLQELILPENRLTALPELPRSIVRLDARLNSIPSTGLRPDAFRVGAGAAGWFWPKPDMPSRDGDGAKGQSRKVHLSPLPAGPEAAAVSPSV